DAVDGGGAVGKPGESAAGAELRPATAVIGHLHDDLVVLPPYRDLGPGGPGVLGDVGQRLPDDEVGGGLHRVGRAVGDQLRLHFDLYRHRSFRCHRGQRGVQSTVTEHRWVDPAGQIAELGNRALGVG